MVTRRTTRRHHLLRPDRELNALYIYSLATLAPRYGVEVHAVVVMSTHEHLIVTDTRGELPRFLQDLHRLVALQVKGLRKWEGPVWDHEKPSVVELRTPQAVIEKIAYVMANPVEAGLVSHAGQWPGIHTRPEQLGRASYTDEFDGFVYVCDSIGLRELSEEGPGPPLFKLAELQAPELDHVPDPLRGLCEQQWAVYQQDLAWVGSTVPGADAGGPAATDAGAVPAATDAGGDGVPSENTEPAAASGEQSSSGGCSLVVTRARNRGWCVLLLLLMAPRLSGRKRSSRRA